MKRIWRAFCAASIKARIAIVAALFILVSFALVGAVLTVEHWLPIMVLTTLAVLSLYLCRLWFIHKRRDQEKKRGDHVRELATKFLFFALHQPIKLHVVIERPFSAGALLERTSVMWADGVPVVRVDLFNLAPETELLPVDFYLIQQLLSGTVSAFCDAEGLKNGPFNGKFSPVVISEVRGGGAFVTVEIVLVEDEKAVRFLQKKTRPERQDQALKASETPAPDDLLYTDEDVL